MSENLKCEGCKTKDSIIVDEFSFTTTLSIEHLSLCRDCLENFLPKYVGMIQQLLKDRLKKIEITGDNKH